MFWIGKIGGALLLPPGVLVVSALAAAWAVWRSGEKSGAMALAALAALLYLLALQPVADALLSPLEDAFSYPGDSATRCEAVAVMGGGTSGRTGGSSDYQLTRASVQRTLAAFRLWQERARPIVVSGGQVWPDGATGAREMAGLLRTLGVPEADLILETESRDTYGNGEQTSATARRRGWNSLCVVTSALHLPRTVRVFNHFGIVPVPVPTDYRAVNPPYGWEALLPRAASLAAAAAALHEYAGLAYYRLRWGI